MPARRILLLCLLLSWQPLLAQESTLKHGEYIFYLANCYGCHTDTENDGKALAGGRALESEFGTFYTPNITPDRETGIGNWSDEDFINALRYGRAPDKSFYYPAFPYTAYQHMTDEDMLALKAWIFSLAPVSKQNKPHELPDYLHRILIPMWNNINRFLSPDTNYQHSRGAYLVNALGHCQQCHTPRNSLGILQYKAAFSGNEDLPTPDIRNLESGLKNWSDEELREFFADGIYPDGDYVSDHMAEVVEFSSSKWREQDMAAVIEYLRQQ